MIQNSPVLFILAQYILETSIELIKALDCYVDDENTHSHMREGKTEKKLAHNLMTN